MKTCPYWCGTSARTCYPIASNDGRLGHWDHPNGPMAYASDECRAARKCINPIPPVTYVGVDWAAPIAISEVVVSEEEWDDAIDENHRLKRKVNSLLVKLKEERKVSSEIAGLLAEECEISKEQAERGDRWFFQFANLSGERERARTVLTDFVLEAIGYVLQEEEADVIGRLRRGISRLADIGDDPQINYFCRRLLNNT